jgi:hypothetical protein
MSKQSTLSAAQAELATASEQLRIAARRHTEAEDAVVAALLLPDDVAPSAPANLRIAHSYGGTSSPLAIEISWDDTLPGSTTELAYIGGSDNPFGPQSLTSLPIIAGSSNAGGMRGPNGEMATLVLSNPANQTIILHCNQTVDGLTSEWATLPLRINQDGDVITIDPSIVP